MAANIFNCKMLIFCLLIFAASATTPDSELKPIPMLCDSIQCPAVADMQCPEDSAVREQRELNAVDLINSNAVSITNAPVATTESTAYNSSQVTDELIAQCCLSKKCVCKTCYIPDCSKEEGEVVAELQPEAMDTPGQCCGKYECQKEPNCTEVTDTEYYWLQSCQRCQCTSGVRICEQSCDEGNNGICESKNLNTFFNDGDRWVDGCYECECVKGEQKCVIPFCGIVNCPTERQVTLKDSCCPVCWPTCERMPNEKSFNYNNEIGYAPAIKADHNTEVPLEATTERLAELNIEPKSGPLAPPCQSHDFPNVVEVVHQNNYIERLYPIAIVGLLIIIGMLIFYIRHLQAKQRSYRPVTSFDYKV